MSTESKDVLAKKAGMRVWDSALPQFWLDWATSTLAGITGQRATDVYDTLLFGTVVDYSNGAGVITPVRPEAIALVATLEQSVANVNTRGW